MRERFVLLKIPRCDIDELFRSAVWRRSIGCSTNFFFAPIYALWSPQHVQRHANSGLLVYGLCAQGLCSVVSQARIPGCQHPILLGTHCS